MAQAVNLPANVTTVVALHVRHYASADYGFPHSVPTSSLSKLVSQISALYIGSKGVVAQIQGGRASKYGATRTIVNALLVHR
jgi:hypothetical protein